MQLVKPTEGGSPLIPLVWPVRTGYPFLVYEMVSFLPILIDFRGSVALDWPYPSISSLSLAITRLRTGSASWA